MTKTTGLLFAGLAAIAIAGAGDGFVRATTAAGLNSDAVERSFARENDITAHLRALSQAMGKELAQMVAGSDADKAIADLGAQRQQFIDLLETLHRYDRAPESHSSSNPQIGRYLSVVDAAWPALDRMIGDAVSWGHLTHYEVLQFEAAARELDQVLAELQGAYRQAAVDFGVHSVILNAIAVAEEQRVLSQEIPKTFFMMVYGVNVPQNRERLTITIAQFERDMRGLVEGNPENGLIAAPTAGIRADLIAAQSTWASLRSSLSLESSGVALDAAAIAEVSELSDTLYDQLDAAVGGLKGL